MNTHVRFQQLSQLRCAWLALLLAIPLPACAQAAGQSRPAIGEVTAKLYYRDSGTFSENVIDNPSFRFWNAVVGGGSAKGAVDAVLVTVKLDVAPDSYSTTDTLHVVVRDTSGIVVERRSVVGHGHIGTILEAYWVYRAGCVPLTITASLRREREYQSVTKRIPFRCGE